LNAEPERVEGRRGRRQAHAGLAAARRGRRAGQLTDEPLGVEGFKFAKRADRLLLLAPVLLGIAQDKQRENSRQARRRRRRYTQPRRRWDHWLHRTTRAAARSTDRVQRQRQPPGPDPKRGASSSSRASISRRPDHGRDVARTPVPTASWIPRCCSWTSARVESRVFGAEARVGLSAPLLHQTSSPGGEHAVAARP